MGEEGSPIAAMDDDIFTIHEDENEDDAYLSAFKPHEDQFGFPDATNTLNFTRVSKAVDIKKLKENLWGCLDKENTHTGEESHSFLTVLDDY